MLIYSGLIGRNWAMLFAAAGCQVSMYDTEPERVDQALLLIEQSLKDLDEQGLLRGKLTRQQQRALMTPVSSVKQAVQGAFYVQVNLFF